VISAIVELTSNRLNDALSLLDQAAPLLDQVEDDAPLGCYHMERAIIFIDSEESIIWTAP